MILPIIMKGTSKDKEKGGRRKEKGKEKGKRKKEKVGGITI